MRTQTFNMLAANIMIINNMMTATVCRYRSKKLTLYADLAVRDASCWQSAYYY